MLSLAGLLLRAPVTPEIEILVLTLHLAFPPLAFAYPYRAAFVGCGSYRAQVPREKLLVLSDLDYATSPTS